MFCIVLTLPLWQINFIINTQMTSVKWTEQLLLRWLFLLQRQTTDTLHYPSPSFDHYLRPVDLSRCITIHTDDGRLTLKYSAINERVSAASAEHPGLISNNVTQMLNEFLVPQVNLRVVTRSWKLKAISHICRVIPGHRAIRAWDNEAGHKLLVALITSKITNRSQPRSVA